MIKIYVIIRDTSYLVVDSYLIGLQQIFETKNIKLVVLLTPSYDTYINCLTEHQIHDAIVIFIGFQPKINPSLKIVPYILNFDCFTLIEYKKQIKTLESRIILLEQ